MIRLVLFVVLAIFVARTFWRIVDGVIEGLSGQPPRSGVVSRGVQMVRDPVCGTRGPGSHPGDRRRAESGVFCSAVCRDKCGPRPDEHRILRADIVGSAGAMRAATPPATTATSACASVTTGSDDAQERLQGFMTPDMMCVTDLAGKKIQGDRDPSSEMLMHLEVYQQRPDVPRRRPCASTNRHGLCRPGIPLDRAVLAEVLTTLGSIPLAEYATVHKRASRSRAEIHQGPRRHAARQPRR